MEPFVGEIRAVGFNFVPYNWALCDGSLLPINRYTALFSILGTNYGGDGKTTFALPDLRGRAIVNAGQGPGLSQYPLGMKTGTESVTLNLTQMPAHVHGFGGNVNVNNGDSSLNVGSPGHNFLGTSTQPQYAEVGGSGQMASGMISGNGAAVGDGQPHDNRQPYLAISYVIALVGIFPQRS
jgi:microcystin-dependent protein